ncbi:HAD family hydrolase [Halovenus rubra]|uniref:HAD family hydrolase n=2 Tax=Halovenus rubra TaxID=869890 RepID=A0ACC7E3D7_9EURY|nr:HAD hydrolase-like protein [Halovenus rubra]
MTGYDSLVLDYDGVLATVLDKEARTEACCRVAFEEFLDRDVTPQRETVQRLSRSVTPETVHTLSRQLDTTADALWEFRDDMLATVLNEATTAGRKRPYPDVGALADLKVPLGIASNNQRRVVTHGLTEYEMVSKFETVHAREPQLESLHNKKPAPTFLESAWADLDSQNPLYVGDKETDVLAAQRAGMDVALIRRDHNRDRNIGHDPTYEVSSLDAVVSLFESG